MWWNVRSLARFDPTRAAERRWPRKPEAAEARIGDVAAALRPVFEAKGVPAFCALAEVTSPAASALRDLLLPGFEVHSLDVGAKSDFHVAVIYDPRRGFARPQAVGPATGVPIGTRLTATIDLVRKTNVIRVFACHWAARFKQSTDEWREQVATFLRANVFSFVHGERTHGHAYPQEIKRHALLLGDLNEEPFGGAVEKLHADRSRQRAADRLHPQDIQIQRARLYNCSWRFLGERAPHPVPASGISVAGTYYWATEKAWRTFDQVIVSGSMLGHAAPYLDEASLTLLGAPPFTTPDGIPSLSDHLPLVGNLVVPKE